MLAAGSTGDSYRATRCLLYASQSQKPQVNWRAEKTLSENHPVAHSLCLDNYPFYWGMRIRYGDGTGLDGEEQRPIGKNIITETEELSKAKKKPRENSICKTLHQASH